MTLSTSDRPLKHLACAAPSRRRVSHRKKRRESRGRGRGFGEAVGEV